MVTFAGIWTRKALNSFERIVCEKSGKQKHLYRAPEAIFFFPDPDVQN